MEGAGVVAVFINEYDADCRYKYIFVNKCPPAQQASVPELV